MTGSNAFGRPAEQRAADWNGAFEAISYRQLRGLPFFDDFPEIRCHFAIVMSKHLIETPLGPVPRLPSPLLALGGFGLVLLHFGLKISQHGTTPRNAHNPQ
jgi:hypothetical protein